MQTQPKKTYKHLGQEDRDRIQSLLDAGVNEAEVARIIGRDKTTISREIKRNKRSRGEIPVTNQLHYQATGAGQKAYVRRKYAKYEGMKIQEHKELRSYILKGLKQHWNPDEISGAMKAEGQPFYASKTAIYEWLYSVWGQAYTPLLYSKRHKPKTHRPKTQKVMIPDRVSISERPDGATNRTEYGHSEGDTMVSGKATKSKVALVVVHERKARYIDVRKIPNLKPESFNAGVKSIQRTLLPMASLSLDNGIENRWHKQLLIPIFFCDPYASWQKGGVENSNRMLRRYFPKGMDLALVTESELKKVVSIINNKPRKILGYKSALQVMTEQGLLRQTATTSSKVKVALRG